MSCSPTVCWCVALVLWGCVWGASAAENEGCYTSGSVAGIVIATVVVTLVMGGLAVAFIWYLWKQRKGAYGDGGKSEEKNMSCPPMTSDKQLIVHESNDYAFDNPYFKDDETDHTTQDAAEKGESGFHVDNGAVTPAQNAKGSNGTTGQPKKSRPFSSLPFHSVFHPSGKKQRATMDDTYISKHLERITVPLRGHDFTGLGFNICGNMRDGIFVKDVLHRGPASESGKIKAGDRIVGVNVSFGAMVYEDALTILSYASPYDVKLEIEKCPTVSSVVSVPHLPSSSPKRLGPSTSFRSCGQRRLFHPLYRSQSIDDLTQIGKDNFLGGNSSGSQRDSPSSATPKRSQSVEASKAGSKTRIAYTLKSSDEASSKSLSSNKGSRKSSTSSCESATKATATSAPPEKPCPVVVKDEEPCTKKEIQSSRFRVEQIHVKTEASSMQQKQVIPVKPDRNSAIENKQTALGKDLADQTRELSNKVPSEEVTSSGGQEDVFCAAEAETEDEKPMAPPRKVGTPAKRRAPAPPSIKTETSAVVHRVDDQTSESVAGEPEQLRPSASEPPPPPTTALPDFVPLLTSANEDIGSSDSSSVASGGHSQQKDIAKDEASSPGKRKASSLGDLTKLDHSANKKASTSSAILERAVSMDLQQSMPGDNLMRQKKILRAPAFESDYDEDKEDMNDTDGGGLKRWDNGLDKVLVGLTNGEVKQVNDLSDDKTTEPLSNDVISGVIESKSADNTDFETLLAVDLGTDISSGEITLQDSEMQQHSTPTRKVIEVKGFLSDDDDSIDDEVPFLASANNEEPSAKHSSKTSTSSVPMFSPVTIHIPIIKPDLTHYEKLPSPPPASTHPSLDPGWRMSKNTTSTEDSNKSPLERISVQSLYRPIFSNKEIPSTDEPLTNPEKMVNGNDSDSSEHHSPTQESTTASSLEMNSTSTLTVTLSPTVANNVTVKPPSNVAGFAKTLIIPGPSEVESLLSLANEPNTPPPNLEPPPKPVENE